MSMVGWMWRNAVLLSFYVSASITGGLAKSPIRASDLPPAVSTELQTFLKCSAKTTKADNRDNYCNTELHIPAQRVPDMRRCLALGKIAGVDGRPSFRVIGSKAYYINFECAPGSGFSVEIETGKRATWTAGVYEYMP